MTFLSPEGRVHSLQDVKIHSPFFIIVAALGLAVLSNHTVLQFLGLIWLFAMDPVSLTFLLKWCEQLLVRLTNSNRFREMYSPVRRNTRYYCFLVFRRIVGEYISLDLFCFVSLTSSCSHHFKRNFKDTGSMANSQMRPRNRRTVWSQTGTNFLFFPLSIVGYNYVKMRPLKLVAFRGTCSNGARGKLVVLLQNL